MAKIDLAFIGGSGLYKIPGIKEVRWKSVSTNFGTPSSEVCIGTVNKKKVAFLPRHGKKHNISPSNINYSSSRLQAYLSLSPSHYILIIHEH